MYKVVKEVRWEAAHRLLNYAGKCAYLHGHSYRAIFTFVSSLDFEKLNKDGMIVDFSILKEKIQRWLDENWDHSCILNEADPLMNILGSRVCVIQGNPTAENMAKFLFDNFRLAFFEITLVSVEVFEGLKSSAVYMNRKCSL